MERARVISTGFNDRHYLYGFGRTEAGVKFYFNSLDGDFTIDEGPTVRLRLSWADNDVLRSPFPSINDVILVDNIREVPQVDPTRPKARDWCPRAMSWCLESYVQHLFWQLRYRAK